MHAYICILHAVSVCSVFLFFTFAMLLTKHFAVSSNIIIYSQHEAEGPVNFVDCRNFVGMQADAAIWLPPGVHVGYSLESCRRLIKFHGHS